MSSAYILSATAHVFVHNKYICFIHLFICWPYIYLLNVFALCAITQIKSPKGNEARSVSGSSTADKRCCAKTHVKHHRWKRKWNCCSAVPDSPDVSEDVIRTISDSVTLHHPASTNLDSVGFPSSRPARLNGMVRTASVDQKLSVTDPSLMARMEQVPNQPQSPIPFAKVVRPRLVRPWPIVRFRHMLRMIGRYRRTDCRRHGGTPRPDDRDPSAIKQNQIRPVSSSTNEPVGHDSVRLPVLPPPSRRKIRHSADLQDLTNSLSFVQQSSRCNSSARRQRRKNAMRNRSPTLSPIHESGLSNPASPQPFRHSHHPGGGYTIAIPQTILDTPWLRTMMHGVNNILTPHPKTYRSTDLMEARPCNYVQR